MLKVKPTALIAGTELGDYRIVRTLATGGFGVVYLALYPQGQQVAVKEYLPSDLATRAAGELKPQVRADKQDLYRLGLKSFFEEGRALAQISHPSVVSVLNFFSTNDTVYMVMSYLKGMVLQEFILAARTLNQPKILRESTIRSLFDEVLLGLRVVHQNMLLHLDIKPANIFITEDNRPVLIDFGAAREVLHKQGDFVRPMYTPGFAAPEMYGYDLTLGPWTDIYAIGASLYSCMKGLPPHNAQQRKENDRIGVALDRLRGVYSDNLIEVVQWCMSLDPLARPQSVFSLQKELNRATDVEISQFTVAEKLQYQMENVLTGRKQ